MNQPDKRTKRWSLAEFERVRDEIRQELVERDEDDAKILAHCIKSVDIAGEELDSSVQICRYIYALSAVSIHLRSGGLKQREVEKLLEITSSILKFQKITAKSKLGFLLGEQNLIVSQLRRNDGRHFESAWEQACAQRSFKMARGQTDDYVLHAAAIRSFRLGFVIKGLEKLDVAIGLTQNDQRKMRMCILRGKMYRVMGDVGSALEHLKFAEQLGQKNSVQSVEIAWEQICCRAQESGDLLEMVQAIMRGRAHYHPDYLIEAYFWIHAFRSKKYIERTAKMTSLARNETIKANHYGFVYRFGIELENFMNPKIPIEYRIEKLGQVLANITSLVSIDKELLALAAAARILSRQKSPEFASLVLERYRSLSLTITGGADHDCLNLVSDLLDSGIENQGIQRVAIGA